MKNQVTVVARPVKVIVNSVNSNLHQWGQIRDAKTNQILHTGRVGYIRRVALKRYNTQVVK